MRELLEVTPGGRVFTSEDAVSAGPAIGLSREHVYKLLSELAAHDAHRASARTSLRHEASIRRSHVSVVTGHCRPCGPPSCRKRRYCASSLGSAGSGAAPRRGSVHAGTHSMEAWDSRDGADRVVVFRWKRHQIPTCTTPRNVRHHDRPARQRDRRANVDRERAIVELLADRARGTRELAAEVAHAHRAEIDFTRLRKYMDRLGITETPGLDSSGATGAV